MAKPAPKPTNAAQAAANFPCALMIPSVTLLASPIIVKSSHAPPVPIAAPDVATTMCAKLRTIVVRPS